MLMFRSKGFQGNAQFHSGIPVDGNELVMFQFDHISAFFGNHICHMAQLARLIRKKYRYRKNPVPQNKPLLYHAGHGDHIHVSAA